MKLTTAIVAKLTLPEGKNDHIEWDDSLPGFGVRLRGNSKRYVIQYRHGVQQRRESLGDCRRVTLDDARNIARKRFAQIELGTDPAAERAKAREAERKAKLTLGAVAIAYLEARADRMRPSTYQSAKLHLTGHWKPLHHIPLGSVTRADVAARLQEIIKERGRVSAARARANLSALYTWSMKEGLCEHNPTIATNNPAEGIEPRDRTLSDAELAAVWRACGEDHFGRITKLLILTGCRRNEVGGLRWSEINSIVLTIAATRSKNRKAHTLTLPPLAMEILASVPRRGDLLFSPGAKGFNSWAPATTALRLRIAEAEGQPLPPFTLHDLRRSMRSGLSKIGIAPHIAELCLNHRKNGIEATYDRHRYEREVASALAQWSEHVAAIVQGGEGSNISALRRA